MRRSLIPMLAAALAFACADAPTTPLLTAVDPGLKPSMKIDYPPPPFTLLEGSASTEYGTFSFTAKFFANKPGNMAWLKFESTTTANVSFSPNARIMSVNGNVSGVGTISIGSNTIQLSEIDTFDYQSYRVNGTISFSGGAVRAGFASSPIGDTPPPECSELCFIDSNNGG